MSTKKKALEYRRAGAGGIDSPQASPEGSGVGQRPNGAPWGRCDIDNAKDWAQPEIRGIESINFSPGRNEHSRALHAKCAQNGADEDRAT